MIQFNRFQLALLSTLLLACVVLIAGVQPAPIEAAAPNTPRAPQEAFSPPATGRQQAGKERADDKPKAPGEIIAWGPPRRGIRMGLAPREVRVETGFTAIEVDVWYENVSNVSLVVPDHSRANATFLMFAGRYNNRPFYTSYVVPRTATAPPKEKQLRPRERFHERFPVSFSGSGSHSGLPDVAPGKSFSLQVGWCFGFRRPGEAFRVDPSGAKDWNLPDAVKSGSITVHRVIPAGDRQTARHKRLSERLETFTLSLSHMGAYPEKLYSLFLHRDSDGRIGPSAAPFSLQAALSQEEAKRLVDRLLREGFLGDATPGACPYRGELGYVLQIGGARYLLHEDLGRGQRMRQRMKTLRGLFDGDAARQMDKLIAQLDSIGDLDEAFQKKARPFGLGVSLQVRPAVWKEGDVVDFLCTLSNTTDRALRIPPMGYWSGLELIDGAGNRLATDGRAGTHVWSPFSQFEVFGPGESKQYLLSAEVRSGGQLWLESYNGGWQIWKLPAGMITVKAQVGTIFAKDFLRNQEAEHPELPKVWRGLAASRAVSVKVTDKVLAPAKLAPIEVRVATSDPKKTHYKPGEPILINITKRNVSDLTETIWHCGFWPNHKLVVKTADGKEVPLTEQGRLCRERFGPDTPRRKNVPFDVDPGKTDGPDGPFQLQRYFDIKPGTTLHIRCRYLHGGNNGVQYIWSNDLIVHVDRS